VLDYIGLHYDTNVIKNVVQDANKKQQETTKSFCRTTEFFQYSKTTLKFK